MGEARIVPTRMGDPPPEVALLYQRQRDQLKEGSKSG